MVVQEYKLAANGFAEEIRNSVPAADTKRILDLSIGILSCLRELPGFQSTLVMYPSTDWGDGNVNSSWALPTTEVPYIRAGLVQ
jgi:hypothetical protein